jgi:hypothetical protein
MKVEPIIGEKHRYYVQSRSNPDIMYIVDAKDKECGCRGFECRKTCEHVKYVIPIDQYIYE